MRKYSLRLGIWKKRSARRLNLHTLRTILVKPTFQQNLLLLVANVIAGGCAYLLHPFLGHLLSIQDYGEAATFIALSLVLFTLTQTIATMAAKYAARSLSGEHGTNLFRQFSFFTLALLLLGLLLSFFCVLAGAPIVAFFHLTSSQEIVLFSLIALPLFAMPLNQGLIQGLQYFGWYALLMIAISFFRLCLALLLVLLGWGIQGVILGIVLSLIFTYALSFWPLRRFFVARDMLRVSIEKAYVSSALRVLMLTGFVSLGIVVLSSLDTMLARHFLSPTEAGLYAALGTIGRTVLFVTNGIAIILFPKVVIRYGRREAYMSLVGQALLGAMALACVVELLFFLLPSPLIRLLFGASFLPISGLLPLYGVAMLFLACSQILSLTFLATERWMFVLSIFGACLLELLLIVRYHAGSGQVALDTFVANAALFLVLLTIWIGNKRG